MNDIICVNMVRVLTNDGFAFEYENNSRAHLRIYRKSSTVAHDLIDHVNGVENIGTVSDELMALGALIRRYEGRKDNSNSVTAITLWGLFKQLSSHAPFFKKFKNQKETLTNSAIVDTCNKFRSGDFPGSIKIRDLDHHYIERLDMFTEIAGLLMQRGYNLNRQRYPDVEALNRIFNNIDNTLRHIKMVNLKNNVVVTLKVNIKTELFEVFNPNGELICNSNRVMNC